MGESKEQNGANEDWSQGRMYWFMGGDEESWVEPVRTYCLLPVQAPNI